MNISLTLFEIFSLPNSYKILNRNYICTLYLYFHSIFNNNMLLILLKCLK